MDDYRDVDRERQKQADWLLSQVNLENIQGGELLNLISDFVNRTPWPSAKVAAAMKRRKV